MMRASFFLLALLTAFPCLAANPPLQPGEMAPLFTVKDAAGETVKLKNHRGKITVLEWTNPECAAVKKHYTSGNIPILQRELGEKGVQWITIFSTAPDTQGFLTDDAIRTYAMSSGITATLVPDAEGTLAKLYRVHTVPHLFVLDADGIIAYAGAIDSKPGTAKGEIDQAVNYVRAAAASLAKDEALETPSAKPYGCPLKIKRPAPPQR